MNILVKIPTFKRPQQLFQTLNSFVKHASGRYRIDYVITINTDDELTNNPSVLAQLRAYSRLKICLTDVRTKIEAYNANINADADFDILIGASDDMLVVAQDYDVAIVEAMTQHFPDTDGVLWFSTQDTEITATLPILGKKYYCRYYYLYHPSYLGYYCDDEFTRLAFKQGKLARFDQCIIKHQIPHYLLMADDYTYLKSMVHSHRDKAWYKIRKSVQFDCTSTAATSGVFPDEFWQDVRQSPRRSWKIPVNMYDEPLSGSEIYLLQKTDFKVTQMSLEEFKPFARSYFRNFRYDIPRIIHQIWLGQPKDQIQEMMETLSKHYLEKYPGWRYILWDEQKLNALDMLNRDLYEQETAYDCKSDIARLEILNKFGGVYLDSDFVWLGTKPIQNLFHLATRGILAFDEKPGKTIGSGYLTAETKRVNNAFFASTIANPIIAFLIGQLRHSYKLNRKRGVVASTGPDFLQPYFTALHLQAADSKYVYPVWFCADPERNPEYNTFKACQNQPLSRIAAQYPDAVLFHKGWDK